MNRAQQKKMTITASDLGRTFSSYRQDETWPMSYPEGPGTSPGDDSSLEGEQIRNDLYCLDEAVRAVADNAELDESKKAALSVALTKLRDQVAPLDEAQQKAVEDILNFIGALVKIVTQPNPKPQIVQAMVKSLRDNISKRPFDPTEMKGAIEDVLNAIPS